MGLLWGNKKIKHTKFSGKTSISYLLIYVCVSGSKECSFFGKCGVPCFLVASVLRLVLLLYYQRILIEITYWKFFYSLICIYGVLQLFFCYLKLSKGIIFLEINNLIQCENLDATYMLIIFCDILTFWCRIPEVKRKQFLC